MLARSSITKKIPSIPQFPMAETRMTKRGVSARSCSKNGISPTYKAAVKSSASLVLGLGLAAGMPLATPTAIQLVLFGMCSTYTAMPIVNAKLKQQIQPSSENNNRKGLRFQNFLYREAVSVRDQLPAVCGSPKSHSGGAAYAGKGAITKMAMFLGVDKAEAIIDASYPELDPKLKKGLAALISGAFQGGLTAPFENVASLQQKSGSSFSAAAKEMITYWKEQSLLPLTSQIARNAIYDVVFFSLTNVGIPFGVAATAAKTVNYTAEKLRSWSQQGKPIREIKEQFAKAKAEDIYKGWLLNVCEMFTIYTLLQLYLTIFNGRKQSEALKSQKLQENDPDQRSSQKVDRQ